MPFDSTRTTPDAGEGFETAVELAVCAAISGLKRSRISDEAPTRYDVKLTPQDLRSPNRSQPYALARHFCCWILYNHPYSKGRYSTPALGRIYNRNHSTICKNSLVRAESFILLGRPHPYAVMLQRVCDALAPSYGPFDIWNHYGLRRPGARQLCGVAA